MLARMLRKILFFQAAFLALVSTAAASLMAWLADWPWWAGLVMFGMVAATGMRILGSVDFTHNKNNLFIVAVSLGMGMIPLVAPHFKQWMSHTWHPLIDSGILLASLSALLLNLFFNGASSNLNDAAKAAQMHSAH